MPATAPQPPTRRTVRLWSSPTVRMLLVLDVVLVVTFLVLAVSTAGPGDASRGEPGTTQHAGTTAPASPDSTATGPARQSSAAAPGPGRFASPSGNIACDITKSAVTCTIASITFTPPVVEGCAGAIGHVVVLDSSGMNLPCPDGPAPGVAGADVPVLAYGSSSTVGQFTCVSATNGVSCTDAGGVGFRLARESLTKLG